MVKRVFISRPLASDSPIRKVVDQYAERQDVELVAESLITFTKVAWDIPETRWLYFYSKTGVRMFNQVCPSHHYKVLTYGAATAAYHQQYGPVVEHCASSVERAHEVLAAYGCQEDITFVCGRQSLRSVHGQEAVRGGSHLRECIVYDQHLREDVQSAVYDLAIITSPLNYESFAKAGSTATEYIAIGPTTAQALRQHGLSPIVAEEPSEQGMAQSLGSWLAR